MWFLNTIVFLITAQDKITSLEQAQTEFRQLQGLALADKNRKIQSVSLFSYILEKDLEKMQQQRNAFETEALILICQDFGNLSSAVGRIMQLEIKSEELQSDQVHQC